MYFWRGSLQGLRGRRLDESALGVALSALFSHSLLPRKGCSAALRTKLASPSKHGLEVARVARMSLHQQHHNELYEVHLQVHVVAEEHAQRSAYPAVSWNRSAATRSGAQTAQ